MAKNSLPDLRNHLFETLEGLKDGTMDVNRAKAICQVSGAIIETAKVEIALIEAVGFKEAQEARFFSAVDSKPPERLLTIGGKKA